MRFIHEPAHLKYADLPAINHLGKRVYCTPEGERLPPITTVLGSSTEKKKSLQEWKTRVGENEAARISRFAAGRGNGMHAIAEKYVRGDEDYMPASTFPHVKQLFNSIKPMLDDNLQRVYCQETPLYSSYLRVAGRVDLCGKYRGKNSIVDFKTSTRPKKREWILDYFKQAAAYSIMAEEQTGIPFPQLVVIMAVDGSSEAIEFVERRDAHVESLIDSINSFYDQYV